MIGLTVVLLCRHTAIDRQPVELLARRHGVEGKFVALPVLSIVWQAGAPVVGIAAGHKAPVLALGDSLWGGAGSLLVPVHHWGKSGAVNSYGVGQYDFHAVTMPMGKLPKHMFLQTSAHGG